MIRCQALLGTFVEIQTHTAEHSSAQVAKAIASAFEVIQLVETRMSAHSAKSDLSRVNVLAHTQAVSVHPWTWRVIALAKELYLQSDGLFNVCIGHVLAKKGLLPVFASQARAMGDIADVELLGNNHIRSKKPVHLDLGGIAKGFAVDRAVDVLLANGISEGVVNAGGDMRVFGVMAHPVQVRSPQNPSLLFDMGSLSNGALATSANYFTPLEKEGLPIGHIVRSQTQQLEKSSVSFSVLAPLCVLADALTKIFMLSGNAHHPCMTRYQAHAFQISA